MCCNITTKKEKSTCQKAYIILGAFLFVLCIFAPFVIYFCNFNTEFGNQENFGDFGSYIGGIFGTLISGCSIILLYRTYKNQLELSKKQLALSKTQLALSERQNYIAEKQIIESSMTSIMSMRLTLLASLEGSLEVSVSTDNPTGKPNIFTGIDYIKELKKYLFSEVEKLRETGPSKNKEVYFFPNVKTVYESVFTTRREVFEYYLKYLYHVLQQIDNLPLKTHQEKSVYSDLFKIQLTESEIFLLFFSSIAIKDRDDTMVLLLDNYGLLDQLKYNRLDYVVYLMDKFFPKTDKS